MVINPYKLDILLINQWVMSIILANSHNLSRSAAVELVVTIMGVGLSLSFKLMKQEENGLNFLLNFIESESQWMCHDSNIR